MKRINPLMQRAYDHMGRLLTANPSLRNRELATTLGVSEHTVGRWRRAMQLPNARDRMRSTWVERQTAVQRVRDGDSMRQVALDMDREVSTIRVWCHRAGVRSAHPWRRKAEPDA